MELVNTLNDKDLLRKWINRYAGFDGTCRYDEAVADTDYLLRFWNKNKKNLFHLLGDKFIFEKEIIYSEPKDDLIGKMESLLYDNPVGRACRTKYCNWLAEYLSTTPLDHAQISVLNGFLYADSLVDNIYKGETFHIHIGDKEIRISHNMKITKILKKIFEALYLNQIFEDFRIEHSKILNTKEVKGTLCLSIHPLDFFTMSDNDYSWESCMNWRNEGCYRMGTVEMCNSPYVVIAYLKGDRPFYFNHWIKQDSWTNKKWRNLFIVHPDVITGIKGYPYQCAELDILALELLRELAKKNLNWEYEKPIYSADFSSNCQYVGFENRKNDCHFEFNTNVMYNDFGNDNSTHLLLAPKVDNIVIDYSGETECMCCGARISEVESEQESLLFCEDCLSGYVCEECNCRTDNIYELDGTSLCEECYYEYRVIDPATEEEHHNSNCSTIYFITEPDDDYKDSPYWEFCADHPCIKVYYDADVYSELYPTIEEDTDSLPNWRLYHDIYCVKLSNATDDGVNLFENWRMW